MAHPEETTSFSENENFSSDLERARKEVLQMDNSRLEARKRKKVFANA
jgi:hypothetical protein